MTPERLEEIMRWSRKRTALMESEAPIFVRDMLAEVERLTQRNREWAAENKRLMEMIRRLVEEGESLKEESAERMMSSPDLKDDEYTAIYSWAEELVQAIGPPALLAEARELIGEKP